MRLSFRIIAVAAVLAIIPLQYLLLANVYRSLAENLCFKIGECFEQSVEEEILTRSGEYLRSDGAVQPEEGAAGRVPHALVLAVNDRMREENIDMNWDNLREIFSRSLAERGLQGTDFKGIEYTIVLETSDASRQNSEKYAEYTYTWRELRTRMVPVSSDFRTGLRAVVSNPYKILFSKMAMLAALSSVISLFVVFALFRLARLLGKLGRLSRMRQDHTYSMIHDMRTPLSTISLIAEDLVSDEENCSGERSEELGILRQECRHLNKMCDQIIAVAKLEQKKLKFSYEEIDIREFYEEIVRTYASAAGKEVIFKIEPECPALTADRLYLTEILSNLIDNSIKYSKSSVEIRLSSASARTSPRRRKFVELRVRDNGIGFSEDMSRKLFMKFERGENTVGMGGHGMGLHYVYQLMRGFRGYIRIVSEPGEFTEVVLGFPAEPDIRD